MKKVLEHDVLNTDRILGHEEQLKENLASALLSSISHDFKTPLASIIGSISAVRHMHTVLNEETRNTLLKTAQEEAERLNTLITNLLNITKLDSGTVQLNYQWQNPEELMERVIRRMQFGLTQHYIDYTTVSSDCLFWMDSILIEQVLQNLLDNAIKYSPEGSIINIAFSYENGKGHIAVSDQGYGILPEHRTQIFEKFFRSGQLKKLSGGAGLGLAICKTIIDIHNGTISIEQNSEQSDLKYPGSTFHIWLPKAKLVAS